MIIELELSDEVARLIEYIPNEMKSEILTDLIRQGIYSKSSIRADEAQVKANTDDINRVIKTIEALVAGGTFKSKAISDSIDNDYSSDVKEVKVDSKPKPTVISLSGIDSDDLDDDLLDLLK